jgi:hypothetical protein
MRTFRRIALGTLVAVAFPVSLASFTVFAAVPTGAAAIVATETPSCPNGTNWDAVLLRCR